MSKINCDCCGQISGHAELVKNKNMNNKNHMVALIMLLIVISIALFSCKKEEETKPVSTTQITSTHLKDPCVKYVITCKKIGSKIQYRLLVGDIAFTTPAYTQKIITYTGTPIIDSIAGYIQKDYYCDMSATMTESDQHDSIRTEIWINNKLSVSNMNLDSSKTHTWY